MNKTNIFIPHLITLDTEFFRRKNFHYKSRCFSILNSLSSRGEIHLILTEIVYREVLSDIKNGSEEVYRAAQKIISKESRICNNSELVRQFIGEMPDAKSIENELLGQFHDFINSAKVEILSIEEVSNQEILSLYFSRQPPFNEGKKYEFPDAFSLLTLDNLAAERDDHVYVVSNDSDWEIYCKDKENLIYFSDLSKLLNYLLIQCELDFEESEIYKILEENIKGVEKEVETQFCKISLAFEDPFNHYLVNSLEGFDIKIKSIEDVCLCEKILVEVQELEVDTLVFLFDTEFDITFSADVDCTDVEYNYAKNDYIGTPFNVSIKRTLSLPVNISMVLVRGKDYSLKFKAFKETELNPNFDYESDVVYISSERADLNCFF